MGRTSGGGGIVVASGASVATGIPFVNNVDFQAPTLPVLQGQTIGTVTATQPVTSWTIVADSSTTLGQGAFFSINNSGQIKITAAGASSGSTLGYQGAPYVLTLRATNSFGNSPDNTGYATIGIPISGITGKPFVGPCTVGYFNEPNFNTASNPNGAGNLATNATGTISTTGTTYKYQDFTSTVQTTGSNNTFIGCRFRGVSTTGACVANTAGTGNSYSYCSFTPSLSSSHPIPMMQWPSAGTQIGVDANSPAGTISTYMIPGANASQFGYSDDNGGTTIDRCDFWGFANHIQRGSGSTWTNIWVHDSRNPSAFTDHTDGIGYLDGGTPPPNITAAHNVITSIGNTNNFAWQGASSAYTGYVMTDNYLTGWWASLFHGSPTPTASSSSFHSNVFATDMATGGAPFVTDVTWTSPSLSWRLNTVLICPNAVQDGTWFSPGDNGLFMYPDATRHAADYTG